MKISLRLASATAVVAGLLLAIPTIAQNGPRTGAGMVCPYTGQVSACPNAGNCPNPKCPMAKGAQAKGSRAGGQMRGAGYRRYMHRQGRGLGYGRQLGAGWNPNCPFVK